MTTFYKLAVFLVLALGAVEAQETPEVLSLFLSARDGDTAALVRLTTLALSGDAAAQFWLGNMYRRGEGVPKDAVQAVNWYRKAAEQGDAAAQFNLGNMYGRGEGVPKDAVQAVNWYRKAAEQGDASAQYNLGLLYDIGEGVPKDAVQAVNWYGDSRHS